MIDSASLRAKAAEVLALSLASPDASIREELDAIAARLERIAGRVEARTKTPDVAGHDPRAAP